MGSGCKFTSKLRRPREGGGPSLTAEIQHRVMDSRLRGNDEDKDNDEHRDIDEDRVNDEDRDRVSPHSFKFGLRYCRALSMSNPRRCA